MYRISRVYLRTSRKGPGGWTTPTFISFGNQASPPQRGGSAAETVNDWSSVRNELRSDKPEAAVRMGSSRGQDGGPLPEVSSWRANKAFDPEVIGRTILGNAYDTFCSSPRSTKLPHISRISQAAAEDERSQTEAPTRQSQSTNWMGGPTNSRNMWMERHFGVKDFCLVDREQLTISKRIELIFNAAFKPREADSRVFGGDNSTKMAEQKEELKNMDSRIVPFLHEDLMLDYLKNINQLNAPSGQIYTRDILTGRLIGLLFFTESERSLSFMRILKRFHQKYTPDFVVVSISVGGKEMMDVSKQFGFYHCLHRDGATWVTRDAGLMIRPWTPMPRLIIVDGTTGTEITRNGLTGVIANPDTCFNEWRRGESGVNAWDWLQTIVIQ